MKLLAFIFKQPSYLLFALNVQRVHISTEEPEASWMFELFGVVGRDVPEYFSLREVFRKMTQ